MTPIERSKGNVGAAANAEVEAAGWLSREELSAVIRNTPLVTMDLIIRDGEGRVLLGYRKNAPARDTWFVPGGRIRKGERIVEAFGRICREETGLEPLHLWNPEQGRVPRLLGIYEHIYDDNSLGDPSFGTHCVAMAYEVEFHGGHPLESTSQHWEMRWFTVEEILANGEVHSDTKAYFEREQPRATRTV